jgi:hypothetical protein
LTFSHTALVSELWSVTKFFLSCILFLFFLAYEFIQYNASTNPNEPIGKALMAGTFIDGSTVYVGKGTSTTQCLIAPNMPARITTATGSAGAHMACYDAVDKLTPFYLKDNPQLIWVKGDVNMTAYMYPVLVVSGAYEYNIGRVNLLNGTTTYQQIGKILTVPNNGFWYSSVSTGDKNDTNFERLVCDGPPPCKAPTAAPPGKHWEGPPTCAFVCNNTKPATIPDNKQWNETTCNVECKAAKPPVILPINQWNMETCEVECINTKPATIPDNKQWNETTCNVECKVRSACSPGSRFNEDFCQCLVIPPCCE